MSKPQLKSLDANSRRFAYTSPTAYLPLCASSMSVSAHRDTHSKSKNQNLFCTNIEKRALAEVSGDGVDAVAGKRPIDCTSQPRDTVASSSRLVFG